MALLSPAVPAAASGTWGPGIAYLDGVICNGSSARTALVSWPGPAGPAFALYGVSGPAGRRSGTTDIPAVGGSSSSLPVGAAGLSQAQIGAVAYLIDRYGSSRSDLVADVAARIVGQVSGDTYVTDCVNRRVGGTSPDVAADLWNEAVTNAGPYQVTVTGPADGADPARPTPVRATVTTASGAAASGVRVRFATDRGSLSGGSAVTDASGHAQVAVTTDDQTRITASVDAVSELIQTTGGSAVPLVSAAAPTRNSGTLLLASSRTADPQLRVATSMTLLTEDEPIVSSLRVTGMRGHRGTATVTAYGPLASSARRGCRGHSAAQWTKAEAAGSSRLAFTGDGNFDLNTGTTPKAGCYQLGAKVVTGNATPNVTRGVAGPIVTVAPVSLTVSPVARGLASRGSLETTLTVRAVDGASITRVAARLVGPRPAGTGCPTSGWAAAPAAPASTSVSGAHSGPVRIRSSRVDKLGCYGFRISAQLNVPGAGSAPVDLDPGVTNSPVLVIAPSVTLTALSATHVAAGGRVQARVTVTGSQDQAGVLSLQLLRLPYTSLGCMSRQWDAATAVPAEGSDPVVSVGGDGTYRVHSPSVPDRACWTVVPVFTASNNADVRASGVAGQDPTLAFLGTARAASSAQRDTAGPASGGIARLVITGVITAGLLALVLGVIIVLARRSRNATG